MLIIQLEDLEFKCFLYSENILYLNAYYTVRIFCILMPIIQLEDLELKNPIIQLEYNIVMEV